ncbi:hypothetical protein ASG31_14050 [Chryseobacterium sp. Leaf404]|nr:hypothetical protein ASG31_14050 [Chryseobacterium sp. Leaf404]
MLTVLIIIQKKYMQIIFVKVFFPDFLADRRNTKLMLVILTLLVIWKEDCHNHGDKIVFHF